MPVHDWVRSFDAARHDFQLGWACRLSEWLNKGALPEPLYAVIETIELRPPAEFCPLPEPHAPVSIRNWEEDLFDVIERPPSTRIRVVDDRRQYACNVVSVRDDLHQPVAAVLWITRQDKETPYRLDAIVRHAVGAITRDVNLLVIDLFRPSAHDPFGIHKAIWDKFKEEPFDLPADKPFTLAAYSAGAEKVAYVENVGVGDVLPPMPIFLTTDRYVYCQLEQIYQTSWSFFPQALKGPLETPA